MICLNRPWEIQELVFVESHAYNLDSTLLDNRVLELDEK